MEIKMVDLHSEYLELKNDMDAAIESVFSESQFINGSHVSILQNELSEYLGVEGVIPCGNGTDALQIALMNFDFSAESEVIVPTHTYVATIEVISLLGFKPVLVDVDPETFTVDIEKVKESLTRNTKAIIPVHLYGQCSDMEPLLDFAKQNNLVVIEDAAQSFGADYYFSNGEVSKSGTIGDLGITSFFPTKTLGCYGDGGAIFTNNIEFAGNCKLIANHGQSSKYFHEKVGLNSRLDSLQAAMLSVKLNKIEDFISRRRKTAELYDQYLGQVEEIEIPKRASYSSHVFHQYTVKVDRGKRDSLKEYLGKQNIPTVIYYPLPLHKQVAYKAWAAGKEFPVADLLSETVLSLPIHTQMTEEMVSLIAEKIHNFFKG